MLSSKKLTALFSRSSVINRIANYNRLSVSFSTHPVITASNHQPNKSLFISPFTKSINNLDRNLSSSFLHSFQESASITNFKMSETVMEVEVKNEKKFKRLPTNALPSNYNITLKPNLTTFKFEGTQEVTLHIKEETCEVSCNSADLVVSSVVASLPNGSLLEPKIELDSGTEVLRLLFNQKLPVGELKLKMVFEGELNDKMKGFYRSKYKGEDGEDRYNAVTQFESTDARRAFPCWDEPAIKATFDVTLIAPKNRVALSNMPVKSRSPYELDSELESVTYETSPLMSTYLLAFIVGEFEYIESTTSDGVLVRVYTPLGKKEQGDFALQTATKCLPYYSEYFGIPYPLPKLDLVAIADFSSGAMENWGLITYRETALLVDDKNTSASSRQWVAIVVAHELAHMWFGNLVTMEWWTHLWLNEGYASFVEYMAVAHLYPSYDIWTQFVTDSHNRALELDGLSSSHPIEVPVGHPDEIQEIFDDISYSKGAAVIRMLHQYLGDDGFRKGMNLYLTRYQYKNTFTEDLWGALGEATGNPVEKIMSTWTRQMGYPIVHVLKSESTSPNERSLTIKQEKYWADPSKKSPFNEYNWIVPLTFSSASTPPGDILHKELLDKEESVIKLKVPAAEWVKLNPGTVGFYRVLYPSEILNDFIPAIKSKEMPPLDRLGLLDDVFAFVSAGKASTVDALKLIEAYKDEDNYTVWASVSIIMSKLNLLLAYTPCQNEFKNFGRDIFEKIEKKMGWTPKASEGHLDALLRSLVINRMISFDNERTMGEAVEKFKKFESGEEEIIPDLRSAVYKSVLAKGDKATLDKMLNMYRNAGSQEEQDRLSRALGAIKNKELIEEVLKFSISGEVRKSDTVFMIIAVGMSKEGREIAWDFFKNNHQHFKDNYPGSHVARVLKCMVENFGSEESAVDVENFFKTNPFPATERSVQQAVEQIRLNAKWIQRDSDNIQQFFTNLNTIN